MLRVISGKYKNRKLDQPPLSITRPTMDRTKEAFFSMFQFKIEGKIFLDLFAGSGSIGIEAVSRGAMKSVCVERDKKAIEVIKKNIESLDISNIDVINKDVQTYIKSKKGVNFDFIYLDPPFDDISLYSETLKLIVENNIIAKESYIIMEVSKPWEVEVPKGLVEIKNKKYGKTHILVFTNNI